MDKNILVIAGSSDIVLESVRLLLDKDFNIYATSRADINLEHDNLHKYTLDVCDLGSFNRLCDKLSDINFDAIIYAAGCAVASPVENLNEDELRRQLDVNLFGLLRTLKFFSKNLNRGARIINISSMAAYGLFPFLSPYCLSKASSDILLRAFSVESGTKCISIRPGAIKTKFWQRSIDDNKNNFDNFSDKYRSIGEFMLRNAEKNSVCALEPLYAAKAVCKAVCARNPKHVITVGNDALLCSFASRFLPDSLLNSLIKLALRIKKR